MSKTIKQLTNLVSVSKTKPRLVYAEGGNLYIQQAAKIVSQYVEPILVFKKASEIPNGIEFKCIAIDSMDLSKYANLLFELRKAKGMTIEQANELVRQPNYLCPLLIKAGEADGEICGIDYTTADTLRPALQIVKTAPNAKLVSSLFVMEKDGDSMIFSDCAININPNSEELASMASMACEFAIALGIEKPNCAMLSYSTIGSGSGESVDKVKKAVELFKQDPRNADYNVYGEIQFDAAYDERVRAKKAKGCTWNRRADVFMFPNIDAGNIGYKIAQRMGGYSAFGPMLVGLAAPVNDLSRGATVEDIIGLSLMTAAQVVLKKGYTFK